MKNSFRTIAVAMILLLAVLFSGCGLVGSGKDPTDNSKKVSEDGEISTAESEAESKAPAGKDVKIVLADSFEATDTLYDTEYQRYRRIPAIDSDDPGAKQLNEKIAAECRERYDFYEDTFIVQLDYRATVYSGIAAITVTCSGFIPASDYGSTTYRTYYYDGATDKEIDGYEDYVSACGFDPERLLTAVKNSQVYKDVCETPYWIGGEDYDFDKVELTGCSFDEKETQLVFQCTYSFKFEGERYESSTSMIKTILTSELEKAKK